jgi:flagellar hook-associated protein FlgK
VIPESQITGGSLGGVLRFRSETLDTTQNALGRIALTLGQNVNDQHRLGQDLAGAPGQTYLQPVRRRASRPAAATPAAVRRTWRSTPRASPN